MTLAEVLADLYPTPGDIHRVVADAGMTIGQFSLNDSAINIWSRVLEKARQTQKMWDLVEIPLREYPTHDPLREAWDRELSQRRAVIAERTDGGDTALSLIIDLIWETRREVSVLRHEARSRLNALELLVATMQDVVRGHAADISELRDRPESAATWLTLIAALAIGMIGGLFAGWGRMVWLQLVRWFGG